MAPKIVTRGELLIVSVPVPVRAIETPLSATLLIALLPEMVRLELLAAGVNVPKEKVLGVEGLPVLTVPVLAERFVAIDSALVGDESKERLSCPLLLRLTGPRPRPLGS